MSEPASPAAADVSLRDATPADVPVLLALIAELAAYERLPHEAVATGADLRHSLFGPTPRAHALLADHAGGSVAMAIYFFSFSTFTGRPSLHVEDIYVRPAHRGAGIGRAFFRHLAQCAVAARCGRMEWSVLDWNEPALQFYRSLGAEARSGWTTMRLTGDGFAAVAAGKPGLCPDPPGASRPWTGTT